MRLIDFNQPLITKSLSKAGWKDDYINEAHKLTYHYKDSFWQIGSDEATSEPCIELEVTIKNIRYVFYFEIQDQIETLLQWIVAYQHSTQIVEFVQKILTTTSLRIITRKYTGSNDEKRLLIKPITLENLKNLSEPDFVAVAVDEFDFYLACTVKSAVYINKEYFPKLIELMEKGNYDYQLKQLSHYADFPSFLRNEFSIEVETDKNGNIINLIQCGDDWILDILVKGREYIRKGSFILLQDDGNVFWRIVFDELDVFYFREKLENEQL